MSVSIYGKRSNGEPVMLDIKHPRYLNMNNGRAGLLLGYLGLPFDGNYGEASIVDVRRAIMNARNRRKKMSERLDERDGEYVRMRLKNLTDTVETLAGMGATVIYWA
jgi:hypothetical protein